MTKPRWRHRGFCFGSKQDESGSDGWGSAIHQNGHRLILGSKTCVIIPPSLPRGRTAANFCGRSWLGAGSLQGLPAGWATLRRAINRGHDSRRNPVFRGGDVSIYSSLLRRTRLGTRPPPQPRRCKARRQTRLFRVCHDMVLRLQVRHRQGRPFGTARRFT